VPATFTQIQLGGLSVFVLSAHYLAGSRQWDARIALATGADLGVSGNRAIAIAGFGLRAQHDLPGFAVGGLYSLWIVALAYGQALFTASFLCGCVPV